MKCVHIITGTLVNRKSGTVNSVFICSRENLTTSRNLRVKSNYKYHPEQCAVFGSYIFTSVNRQLETKIHDTKQLAHLSPSQQPKVALEPNSTCEYAFVRDWFPLNGHHVLQFTAA